MNIEVTSRHQDIPDALRTYASERISNVERFGEEFQRSEVVFDHHANTVECEVILHRVKGTPIVATDSAEDGRSAVDGVASKLERQFLKLKEKQVDRNHGH